MINVIKKYKTPVIAWVLYCLFLLLFSTRTSPLFPYNYGSDSAIFRLIGKGVANGKTLYIDLFDHKGPILFYLQALGSMFGGYAIFIIQCIFGFISIFLLYKIFKLLTNRSDLWFWVLSLIGFVNYSWIFQNGNYTEEMCMPLIYLCLYYFVDYFCSDKEEHNPRFAYVYGICFGIISFFRMNNAVSIAFGVLAIIVKLVIEKKWQNIMKNFLYGFAGVATVTVLVLLISFIQGNVYEMINATFLHNLLYFNETKESLKFGERWVVLYYPIFLSFFFIVVTVFRNKKFTWVDFLLFFLCLGNLLCLLKINQYVHYFCMFIPVYYCILFKYLYFKLDYLWIFVLVGIFFYSERSIRFNKMELQDNLVKKAYIQEHEAIVSAVEIIPQAERDSVIGFDIPTKYYLQADIIPCYKYFALQTHMAKSDPTIMPSFIEWLENEGSLWVITLPSENNETIISLLNHHYSLVSGNSYINVWNRIK